MDLSAVGMLSKSFGLKTEIELPLSSKASVSILQTVMEIKRPFEVSSFSFLWILGRLMGFGSTPGGVPAASAADSFPNLRSADHFD